MTPEQEEFIAYVKGVHRLFGDTHLPRPKVFEEDYRHRIDATFGAINRALVPAVYSTDQEERYQAAPLVLWCRKQNEEIEDYIRMKLLERRQVKIKP